MTTPTQPHPSKWLNEGAEGPPDTGDNTGDSWWDWRNLPTLTWGRSWRDIFANLTDERTITDTGDEHMTDTLAPSILTLGSANFNFGFGRTAQLNQAKRMKAKCHHLYASELEHSLIDTRWTGIKPNDESIWWKRGLKVSRAHARPCVIGGHHGLGNRYFIRSDITMPWGTIRRIGVHMPPARLHDELYPRYTATLHDMIHRSPHPVIVDGDWNQRISTDPAQLHEKYGFDWHGSRIDGYATDDRIRSHVGAYHEEITDARRQQDNHPDCYLNIKM